MLTAAFVFSPAAAAAQEEILDTSALAAELPEEAEPYLYGVTPSDLTAVKDALGRIGEAALGKIREAVSSVLKTAGVMLIVCVLVAMSDTLDTSGRSPEYVMVAGVAAIGAAALSDFDSFLYAGLETLEHIQDYSKVLIPTLASAVAFTGSAGSAAAKYGATAMFMDVLLTCARQVIVPCVCAFAALSIADAAVGNQALKAAKKLVKTLCTMLLTALCTAYTAWLAFSGVVAGTADALTARMAKTAVSTALPVVGSILSDAAGTLAAAAGLLRGSIGLFGVAAVLGVCIGPFIALGARYLAYKLAAGLCSCVADQRLSRLVNDMGVCFGMILAMNGAGALMMFISIYSLINTVL